jgi:hypothetical protein
MSVAELALPMTTTAVIHSSASCASAAKLVVAFWDYPGDRLSIPDQPARPFLPDLIPARLTTLLRVTFCTEVTKTPPPLTAQSI